MKIFLVEPKLEIEVVGIKILAMKIVEEKEKKILFMEQIYKVDKI